MSTSETTLQLMTIEEVERISMMNFENKQAQARGEQPPHQISQDDLVRALRTVRSLRATGAQRPASKSAGGATMKEINLDDF